MFDQTPTVSPRVAEAHAADLGDQLVQDVVAKMRADKEAADKTAAAVEAPNSRSGSSRTASATCSWTPWAGRCSTPPSARPWPRPTAPWATSSAWPRTETNKP